LYKDLGLLSDAGIKDRKKVEKEFAIDFVVKKLVEMF